MTSPIVPQKRCSKKDHYLPATNEYFARNKNSKDGLHWWCKECSKEYNKEHPDVTKKANDKYIKNHPTARAEAVKRYRKNHPDKVRQQKREHGKRHPDKIQALNKRSYEKHKEVRKAKQRDYGKTENARLSARRHYLKHRDTILVKKKEYAINNPEKVRTNWRNMRALRVNAIGKHTANDILRMYEEQEGRCGYCGITLDNKYHVDHMQPVSRGGSNWPDNLIVCCAECNLNKHNKTLEEWIKVRGW